LFCGLEGAGRIGFLGKNREKIEKHGFNLGEKRYAHLEMDVYGRTAGLGEHCRAATGGITTFDAA
jgi:hypothetical protein